MISALFHWARSFTGHALSLGTLFHWARSFTGHALSLGTLFLASIILGTAGTLKLADALQPGDALPWIAVIEILLAVLFASGIKSPFANVVLIGTFSTLGTIALTKVLHGEASCGCFGEEIFVRPEVMFGVDLLIVVMGIATHGTAVPTADSKRTPSNAPRGPTVAYLLRLGAAAAIITLLQMTSATWSQWMAFGMDRPFSREQLVGRPFPWTREISHGPRLMRDEWIVVFFDPECGKCRVALERYQESTDLTSTRVAFVDVTGRIPGASADSPLLWMGVNHGSVVHTRTPFIMRLRNGVVVDVSHERLLGLALNRSERNG